MDYYDDYLDDVKKSREERITKMLNEFDELKKENKKLKKQLALCNVVGRSEQLSKRPNTTSTLETFTKSEKQQKIN